MRVQPYKSIVTIIAILSILLILYSPSIVNIDYKTLKNSDTNNHQESNSVLFSREINVLMYGFKHNDILYRSLEQSGLNPILILDDRNLLGYNIDYIDIIVINSSILKVNDDSINKFIGSVMLNGKVVAFVNDNGINTTKLGMLLHVVLHNNTDILNNILSSLYEKSYSIKYDSSGNIVSNTTGGNVLYIFMIKLPYKNSTSLHIYAYNSAIEASYSDISNYLIMYIKEVMRYV